MIIGGAQIASLNKASMLHFEDRMHSYLARFFSEAVARIDAAGLRSAIRQGVTRAEAYGIKSEKDVARYIVLSFFLGLESARGVPHSWVSELLQDHAITPKARLKSIYDRISAIRRSEGLAARAPGIGP